MGFFDIFKKKTEVKQPHTVASTPVNNQATANEETFKMYVEDIFLIRGRGVVLTGRVSQGVVRVQDTVYINGNEYKVIGIEMFRKLLTSAEKGDNIGLLINTDNPHAFQRNNLISTSRIAETNNSSNQQSNAKQPISVQEIVNMARSHEPADIYEYNAQGGRHLTEVVRKAVESIMPNYDGLMDISTALMLNNPQEMKQKIEVADIDTLLIFFKFLAIEASNTQNKDIIGTVQQFLIQSLQKKLS